MSPFISRPSVYLREEREGVKKKENIRKQKETLTGFNSAQLTLINMFSNLQLLIGCFLCPV